MKIIMQTHPRPGPPFGGEGERCKFSCGVEDIEDKIYIADLSRLAKLAVLVTGGGGFLGRAIIDQLLLQGCRVRSFSRGDYPELRKLGVSLLRGDLADEVAVAAPRQSGVEALTLFEVALLVVLAAEAAREASRG